MGSAAAPGRAAWVLAGGLLAAALALSAGLAGRGGLPGGPSPLRRPLGAQAPPDLPADPGAGPERTAQHGDISRDVAGTAANGVVFQKCAVVSGPSVSPTALVRLLVNNTRTPAAADLSDLLLLDNITGLAVRESPGNQTSPGLQVFRRKFLQVGDSFSVSYTASLQAGDLGPGEVLTLPAQLTFQSPAANRTQLKALFTITAEEKVVKFKGARLFEVCTSDDHQWNLAAGFLGKVPKVLPNHGLHAAGFFVAFLASLALTWLTLSFMVRYQCLKGSMLTRHQVQHHESRLEHSQFTSVDGINEDLALNDQLVDILSSEDSGSMLQALEELEIATLNRADLDLEACRTQISRDVISLLLRGLTSGGHLSPAAERRLAAAFKKQFLLLEREVQEEYDRKMVALTAECDLEMRRKTESQCWREMAAMERAEELLKRASERSAGECSSLLRTLHGLEQEQLRRSLALQQEEDLATAHRQLAVFQRSELHGIFFAQIKSALCKGDLKPEAARALLQDYGKAQEAVEELMDFLQASRRFQLSRRAGHRECLVQSLRAAEARGHGLLGSAAAQLAALIQKHERAGYLDESQAEALLERAQTEVFSVQQKLDADLKQEKKKLRQKLIMKRRREMLQKHKEQRRERLSAAEAFRAAEGVGRYLGRWRGLAAEQGAALEALRERLDQAALADLRALVLSLFEKAAEELRRVQTAAVTQELRRRGAPWLFLQQVLEEHGRETAARAERLEGEERGREQEGVQSARQRLRDDALEASLEEQAELRHWGRLIFTRLCSSAFSLSEEELLRLRQGAHGCFAQMDRGLALPRIRARVLLQRFQTAWREAECLKLDQALAVPEPQLPSRPRKPRAKSKGEIELLKKRIEDKIQLFDEPAPEDLAEKVRAELLRERVQQLEAQEGGFAESLVALQFQKAARLARALGAYAALLSVRDLLLEELSESETLAPFACAQILESHGPELQELERKLEDELAHQEAVQRQRALARQQQWAGGGPAPLDEPEDSDADRQISGALRRALGKSQEVLERRRQSLREEREEGVLLEDLLESLEADTFVALHGQGLRLASYLCRLTMVPAGTLHRILSVALPAASQPELPALLESLSQEQPGPVAEEDGGGEQADAGRRGKHQGWWRALESKLRGELVREGLERMQWARRRKESILKKACPPLRERVMFSGKGSWPRLSLESGGELVPVPLVGAESTGLLDTGEKLFIFRNLREPEVSLHVPRRKKKSFLQAKKAALAWGGE